VICPTSRIRLLYLFPGSSHALFASQSRCADIEICSVESSVLVFQDPRCENIPLANFRKSVFPCAIPPRLPEGRIAVVTTREAGMRWT
jgi:hypothetical protein